MRCNQSYVHPDWVRHILRITQDGVPTYLPSEIKSLIRGLATPLEASAVEGELTWEQLRNDHPLLAHGLRKKLDLVPPKRDKEVKERRHMSEEAARRFQQIPGVNFDEFVLGKYRAWSDGFTAPTCEILMDIAFQLSQTSEHSLREWFKLLCLFDDPITGLRHYDSFLEDPDEWSAVTETARQVESKLYGRNGIRTVKPIETLPTPLQALTKAFREGRDFTELLTLEIVGDTLGDTTHN